jgi:uncharacterized protein YabN with tetrapyrrole methylase and pyrophosphatase domain
MFSLVNLARFRKFDPELLMSAANTKFENRFTAMEKSLQATGITLDAATSAQLEHAWELAKAGESQSI